MSEKIAFIIQARMGSSRFPGKVLMPMPLNGGKPMIQWITDQLMESRMDSQVIVATSKNSSDDELYKFTQEHKILCFRGSVHDVLSRYAAICREYKPDVAVRLTGDNPLLDIEIIDKTVRQHINHKNDYTSTTGLPTGMNVEVISGSIFSEINNTFQFTRAEKEHVTLHIKNSESYKNEIVEFSGLEELENLRLTVDYPSDFALLSTLLSFYSPSKKRGVSLIKFIMNHYPWVFRINDNNVQKVQYRNINDEVLAAVEILQKFDMPGAAKILENHNV